MVQGQPKQQPATEDQSKVATNDTRDSAPIEKRTESNALSAPEEAVTSSAPTGRTPSASQESQSPTTPVVAVPAPAVPKPEAPESKADADKVERVPKSAEPSAADVRLRAEASLQNGVFGGAQYRFSSTELGNLRARGIEDICVRTFLRVPDDNPVVVAATAIGRERLNWKRHARTFSAFRIDEIARGSDAKLGPIYETMFRAYFTTSEEDDRDVSIAAVFRCTVHLDGTMLTILEWPFSAFAGIDWSLYVQKYSNISQAERERLQYQRDRQRRTNPGR